MELLWRADKVRHHIWRFVWPAAAVVIGALFIIHVQHGSHEAVAQALVLHRMLGTLLIATGLLRAAEIATGFTRRWLSFSWGVTLLAAGVLLIAYREPEVSHRGAHQPTNTRSS